MNTHPMLESTARKLLSEIGCTDAFTLQPIIFGSNNRVARVDCGNRRFVLKSFFQDEDDPRDRFATELAFTDFAQQLKLRCVPQPLASDRASRAILFSFAPGRIMTAVDVGVESVSQAMDFVVALNERRDSANELPLASEACLSLIEHLQLVDARVARLHRFADDELAKEFVATELMPFWKQLRNTVERAAGGELGHKLSSGQQCLSPSDFGFHNALLDEDGHITFVDFEYAGWDDPARMICDFFCQVAVPIPDLHLDPVLCRLSDTLPDSQWLRERVAVVMPIHRLKWCCILLNEFLPRDRARREFAGSSGRSSPSVQTDQLNRARELLAAVAKSHALTSGAA